MDNTLRALKKQRKSAEIQGAGGAWQKNNHGGVDGKSLMELLAF